MWLMEEVGELAAALREGTREEQAAEFADVLAWLTTIANVVGRRSGGGGAAEVWGGLPRLRTIRLHVRRRRQTVDDRSEMWEASLTPIPSMIEATSAAWASHNLLRTLAAGAALASAAAPTCGECHDAMHEPRIEAIRVGIAESLQGGYWTPVRVDVDGRWSHRSGQRSKSRSPTATAWRQRSARAAASDSADRVQSNGGALHEGRPDGQPDPRRSSMDDESTSMSVLLHPAAKPNRGVADRAIAGDRRADRGAGLGAIRSDARRFADRACGGQRIGTSHWCELNSVSDLPTEWFGYEAVDVLVIAAGDGTLCNELAADETRFAALVRWVELGGRLVILCGGENAASELLAEGGPLGCACCRASWRKWFACRRRGRWNTSPNRRRRLPARRRIDDHVPRLIDVDGSIEVYAGQRPTDLPLVVRSARGLRRSRVCGRRSQPAAAGRLAGPRPRFCRRCCGPIWRTTTPSDASQTLVTRGYNDLVRRTAATAGPIVRWRGADRFSARHRAGDCLFAGARAARLLARAPLAAAATGGMDHVSADRAAVRRGGAGAGELAQGGRRSRASIDSSWSTSTRSPGRRAARFGRRSTARAPSSSIWRSNVDAGRSDEPKPKFCFRGGACRARASAECKPAARIWESSASGYRYAPDLRCARGRAGADVGDQIAARPLDGAGRTADRGASLPIDDGLVAGSIANRHGPTAAQRAAALRRLGAIDWAICRRASESKWANSSARAA